MESFLNPGGPPIRKDGWGTGSRVAGLRVQKTSAPELSSNPPDPVNPPVCLRQTGGPPRVRSTCGLDEGERKERGGE